MKKTWCDAQGNAHTDVDAGLSDTWLDSINSLIHWQVRSTCEGHPRPLVETEGNHARITLSLKEQYFNACIRMFELPDNPVVGLLKNWFDMPSTRYVLSYEIGGRSITIPSPNVDEGSAAPLVEQDCIMSYIERNVDVWPFRLNIHHTEARQQIAMPSSVGEWLGDINMRLHSFDNALVSVLGP